MIENLLWPTTTKVTQPPQLLVDLFALFNGKISAFDIPLIGEYNIPQREATRTKFRLIDVGLYGSNTFRIGFVSEIIGGPPNYKKVITLPFQNIDASIDEFRCHGWDEAYANILSSPNETEVKKMMLNRPMIDIYRGTSPSGHSSLFKMTSHELEGGGSGQQFSSNGSYVGIGYQFTPAYVDNLSNEFPNMWEKYSNKSSKTVAVETVVNVKVYSGNTDYGFKIGIS